MSLKEQIEQLYWEEGLSQAEVAERLGSKRNRVKYIMERFGIPRRPWLEANQLSVSKRKLNPPQDQLEELYIERGMSSKQIADIFKVTAHTIRYYLNRYGIPRRTLSEMGKKRCGALNPNWKGGKMKTLEGYIRLKTPNHARANNAGYVLEHILVWEKVHGKPLPK